MTQAFNLAQLANNLNTSGQLDATDGLIGLVANANLASSGTPDSTTFLRGDRVWQTLTQTVLRVQNYTISSRFSAATGSTYGNLWTGQTFTKQSASSTIIAVFTWTAFNEANGAGNWRFYFGNSSVQYGANQYVAGANSRSLTQLYIITGNTQTGSVSWYVDGNYNPYVIINPNSSDDARFDAQQSSRAVFFEVV